MKRVSAKLICFSLRVKSQGEFGNISLGNIYQYESHNMKYWMGIYGKSAGQPESKCCSKAIMKCHKCQSLKWIIAISDTFMDTTL